MKIRTDFVTNSSSSSYCVSLGVDPVGEKKKISLNLWPNGEDGTGQVLIGMRTDLDVFIEQVKACSTVDELKRLLVNLLDFSYLPEYAESLWNVDINYADPNEVILQALAKFCEDTDKNNYDVKYAFQISESFDKFREKLSKITSLSDIKSITVTEYFTGWGEFASDGVHSFLSTAIPEKLDWHDENAVKEALKGKFDEAKIKSMIRQIRNNSICQFSASIYTTINITTGEVTRKYSFDAF